MLSPRHAPDDAGGGVAVDSVRPAGADVHYVGDVLPSYSGQDEEVSSNGGDYKTPELPSPLRTGVRAGGDPILSSASLCQRRLEEADGRTNGIGSTRGSVAGGDAAAIPTVAGVDGPLMLVSEEEYARVSYDVSLVWWRQHFVSPSEGRRKRAYGCPYRSTCYSKYDGLWPQKDPIAPSGQKGTPRRSCDIRR